MATTNPDTPKGILLYQPRGAAGEYAKWALNLYNGCTHGCTYCYNRRGTLSHAFGDKPKLAAPIVKYSERYGGAGFALDRILRHDIEKIGMNRLIQDGGIFMSFKCDPLEKDTDGMTFRVLTDLLSYRKIPVTILTKSVEWLSEPAWIYLFENVNRMLSKGEDMWQLTIGVTITGMDDMEPNAPSTADRIALLKTIREQFPHIRTFVSLEPVIDITKAMNNVIYEVFGHTDEIRIGCQSPLKRDRYDPKKFLSLILMLYKLSPSPYDEHIVTRITLKHSVRAQVEFFPPDIRDKCLALIQKIEDSQR